ncbi:MAG TPA: hypothetical protein VGL89_05750 [Candidatus Koribacter sp.]
MADAVHNVKQEYWRPASGAPRMDPVVSDATCECGAEYLLGARYCHICGADRVPDMGLRPHGFDFVEWLDFALIRERTGFGTASLVLFMLGLCCAAVGIAVGFLYTVNTQLDWQAVQMWRIEWLLGAAVAFLAAIALKKAPSGRE